MNYIFTMLIVCIGLSTSPPQKPHPLFLTKQHPSFSRLKSANCPSLQSVLSNPSSLLVSLEPSLKVGFFSKPPKYWSYSSPSYLLKVTKFLVEISQFEFLVMTNKDIFAHKRFLSLNISDVYLFLCENCNPSPE